jgi:hypothetical protein
MVRDLPVPPGSRAPNAARRPAPHGGVTKLAPILFVVLSLVRAADLHALPAASADTKTSPGASDKPSPTSALTPDTVMASLDRVFAWYRQTRVVVRSSDSIVGGVFARDDEQTAREVLKRAFEVARAQAAVVARAPTSSPGGGQPSGRAHEQEERLQAAVGQDEADVARLRDRLRVAPRRTRPTLEQELAVANDRLELDRARLDFVTKLEQFDASNPGAPVDLDHRIQALQDAVPEVNSRNAAPESGPPPTAVEPSGTWALVHRLLALQQTHGRLEDLATATSAIERIVENDRRATVARVSPIMTRLQALVNDPSAAGALAEGQRQFHDLLEQGKLLAAVVVPLRQEAELLRRYTTDLQGWQRAIDEETRRVLQSLGFELIGVVIALAVIMIGSVLWRVAATRYVADVYRRRLLLTIRNVTVVAAVALVLVFHFTSELTALVTALGFAAAGIAFALQNVILAVAGYFAIVAPNGIRVGDRVSLQGPFAYVHGEVAEVGFVRIKLRELAGEPLRPTGRTVSFPNSVVFTGSFFKHPEGEGR